MAQLRNHLADPSLRMLLPQLQLQTFQDDIDEACKVIEELDSQIENLLGPGSQNLRGIERLWRDVVSMTREAEFVRKFETVQRYNEQIHRRLSGVQLALSTRNL